MVTQNVDRQEVPFLFLHVCHDSLGVLVLMHMRSYFRLHHRAGSNPLELHGTVYTVACLQCGYSVSRDLFQDQVKILNPKVRYLALHHFLGSSGVTL